MALAPRRWDRRSPRWLVSLALHLSILALLLIAGLRRERVNEYVPPADFAMVFEGKSPVRSSGPNPELTHPTQPGSPAPTPATPAVPPIPPMPFAQPVLPPPPPPAPPLQQAEGAPAAPTPRPVTPPTPAPAAPPAPSSAATPVVPPAAPPAVALLTPRAVPVPPRPPPESRRPPEKEAKPAAPPREPAFPAPMGFSFGPAARTAPSREGRDVASLPRAVPPRPGHLNTLDLSFGPQAGGSLTPSSSVMMEGVPVSTDWLNEVTAWWQRHAYYPPQAGLNGEDGDVTLHMQVDHNGHVSHLELETKSGSQWLDLGALAIFRDAYLPPLPPDMPDKQIPFHVTIHFVLIRGG